MVAHEQEFLKVRLGGRTETAGDYRARRPTVPEPTGQGEDRKHGGLSTLCTPGSRLSLLSGVDAASCRPGNLASTEITAIISRRVRP